MKALVSIYMFSFVLTCQAQVSDLEIHFLKNIEFLGYIIELGDPSNNDPNHAISKLIHQYPENSSKKSLEEIFSMGADIDYDVFISLMHSLPDLPLDPSYQVPAQQATDLGFKSDAELNFIRTLVQKVNTFYIESGFEKIWTDLKPYRDSTLLQLTEFAPYDSVIKEVEFFYGSSFPKYEIVPSLTIWSGPGWGGTNAEGNTARFTLGPIEKDYIFKMEGFQSLAIHEFGHAFANQIVLQHDTELKETEALFLPIEPDMVPQGYSNWKTCIVEHFVRAGEVIVLEQLKNSSRSEALLQEYRDNRKFIYLDFIVQKLKEYRVANKLGYKKSVKAILLDLHDYYLKD
jgi:hypothetical protein